ncbi:hypothetical protein Ate01nite_60670 [Actinoplanes teichomyceticus]|nr:hypothetical protein Ate01nite_60670 [Actinoplanes teichomyceticus]
MKQDLKTVRPDGGGLSTGWHPFRRVAFLGVSENAPIGVVRQADSVSTSPAAALG